MSRLRKSCYLKFPKYSDTPEIAAIILKLCPNDADRMVNSVDHDQTAPRMANIVDHDQNTQSDLGLHCLPRPFYPKGSLR